MATAILENGVRCCSQVAAETTARHHEEPPRGKYGARVALSRVMGFQMQGRFYTGLKSAQGTGPGKRRGNPVDWVFQTRPERMNCPCANFT